jgi:hypothetical protein
MLKTLDFLAQFWHHIYGHKTGGALQNLSKTGGLGVRIRMLVIIIGLKSE